MAIRLGNSCINCDNLSATEMCTVHQVKVSNTYTCDSFEMKEVLKDERNCTTCLRYETDDCINSKGAAPGMLCASWAPKHARA